MSHLDGKSNHNGPFTSPHIWQFVVRLRTALRVPRDQIVNALASALSRRRCYEELFPVPPPMPSVAAAGRRNTKTRNTKQCIKGHRDRQPCTCHCSKATRQERQVSTNAYCACTDASLSCLSCRGVVGRKSAPSRSHGGIERLPNLGGIASPELYHSYRCVSTLRQGLATTQGACRQLRRFQLLAARAIP